MSRVVHFRVDDDERAVLDENASSLGLSRSAYLRFLATMHTRILKVDAGSETPPETSSGEVLVPVAMLLDFSEMKNELRMQGTNLNQSVKSINMIAKELHLYDADGLMYYFNLLKKEIGVLVDSYNSLYDSFVAYESNLPMLCGDGRDRS